MVSEGIATPSVSPWAAPIVIVPKKDSTIRLCVDFRGLNEITVFDPQPMPKIEEILNKLGNAKVPYKSRFDKRILANSIGESAKERVLL